MRRKGLPAGLGAKWQRLLAGIALLAVAVAGAIVSTTEARATTLSIAVSGARLVNGSGQTIRLLGVDRSGTEYACIQGWGIFDGPSDAASVAAIAAWHTNAVRVPLNEDCWLNINMGSSTYGGAVYQQAIASYVSLLHQYGLYAILDLHWNAPGTQQATGQQLMADADHAPAFWQSVATYFKNDPAVLFDLYNEPHDIDWGCWLNGGCTTPGFPAAGMQSLVNAVRGTGATQPIMVGGNQWAGDLSAWLANEPSDPDHALVASVHNYNFSGCGSTCWATTIQPVAAVVPVVTGELGENDCAESYIDSYMQWADSVGVSYLGWSWNTADCSNFPALITDYSGTPTAFGLGLKNHLAGLATSPTPPPSSSPTPSRGAPPVPGVSRPLPARSSPPTVPRLVRPLLPRPKITASRIASPPPAIAPLEQAGRQILFRLQRFF